MARREGARLGPRGRQHDARGLIVVAIALLFALLGAMSVFVGLVAGHTGALSRTQAFSAPPIVRDEDASLLPSSFEQDASPNQDQGSDPASTTDWRLGVSS